MSGPDGALWLAQTYPGSVARIATNGVVSTVSLTATNAEAGDVTVGADRKLWVADYAAGRVSRISAVGGTGKTIQPTHGQVFTGSVASFKDGTPVATQADFTGVVNWGDGIKSSGTVTGADGGPFSVSGTHTYASSGTFKLVVTLTDNVDKSTYNAGPGKAVVK